MRDAIYRAAQCADGSPNEEAARCFGDEQSLRVDEGDGVSV